jgi:hypothetical protein
MPGLRFVDIKRRRAIHPVLAINYVGSGGGIGARDLVVRPLLLDRERRPRRVPRVRVFPLAPIAVTILAPTRRNRREALHYAGRADVDDQPFAVAPLGHDVGDIDVAAPDETPHIVTLHL